MIGCSQTHPKTAITVISWVKLRTSKLADTITWSIGTQAHEKCERKVSLCISRDCPIFWVHPLTPGTGKATNFKYCVQIQRIARSKSLL